MLLFVSFPPLPFNSVNVFTAAIRPPGWIISVSFVIPAGINFFFARSSRDQHEFHFKLIGQMADIYCSFLRVGTKLILTLELNESVTMQFRPITAVQHVLYSEVPNLIFPLHSNS